MKATIAAPAPNDRRPQTFPPLSARTFRAAAYSAAFRPVRERRNRTIFRRGKFQAA